MWLNWSKITWMVPWSTRVRKFPNIALKIQLVTFWDTLYKSLSQLSFAQSSLTSQAPFLGEQPRPWAPVARLWHPEYIWVVCVLLLFNRFFCVFFSSFLPSSRHCSTVPWLSISNPDGDLRLSLHAPLQPSFPTQQTLPTPLRALSSNFHLTRACSHQVLREHLWSHPPAADRQVQEADSQAREGTYEAAAAS